MCEKKESESRKCAQVNWIFVHSIKYSQLKEEHFVHPTFTSLKTLSFIWFHSINHGLVSYCRELNLTPPQRIIFMFICPFVHITMTGYIRMFPSNTICAWGLFYKGSVKQNKQNTEADCHSKAVADTVSPSESDPGICKKSLITQDLVIDFCPGTESNNPLPLLIRLPHTNP